MQHRIEQKSSSGRVQLTTLAAQRTNMLARCPPSIALRASNDDGNRKLEVPEQPEYDVEGVDLKGVLKGDPVTLTLIGFGLIAFNFFVLAGFGSGGL